MFFEVLVRHRLRLRADSERGIPTDDLGLSHEQADGLRLYAIERDDDAPVCSAPAPAPAEGSGVADALAGLRLGAGPLYVSLPRPPPLPVDDVLD